MRFRASARPRHSASWTTARLTEASAPSTSWTPCRGSVRLASRTCGLSWRCEAVRRRGSRRSRAPEVPARPQELPPPTASGSVESCCQRHAAPRRRERGRRRRTRLGRPPRPLQASPRDARSGRADRWCDVSRRAEGFGGRVNPLFEGTSARAEAAGLAGSSEAPRLAAPHLLAAALCAGLALALVTRPPALLPAAGGVLLVVSALVAA